MSLFDYQQNAKDHLLQWKVGALFMDAGTGKTRVACELINSVPDIDLVLWVGPLRTITSTDGVKSEIEKSGGINARTIYVGIESIQQSDRIYLSVLSEVESSGKVFIILDESIKIKNLSAKRTQRMINISEKVEYKLILNGTPITRNVLDVYAQMYFLSPQILNMSLPQYKDIFCCYTTITKRSPYGYSSKREFITGYENIDYLYSLIRHYIYEFDLKLNVKQRYNTLAYSISEEEREKYHEIKDHFLSDETLEFRNNNIFLEMTQKMQHAYCLSQDKFKICDCLFDMIEQNKTIIFCKYISSQEECRKKYKDALVLSYQKESFGLNLQSYHYTIYFDKVWDYALRSQSTRRTYRTGQQQDCTYFDLTGNVGLDNMIDQNIDKKISMSEYFKKVSKKQLMNDL